MSLAADGKDGNGLQLEKFQLNFSCFFSFSKNRYNGRALSLCELRLQSSFRCSEIMLCKGLVALSINSTIVWTKNPKNSGDSAPLINCFPHKI